MLNNMDKVFKTITDVGIALLGLVIVAQILFGSSIPFFSGNVINSIASVISTLGAQGLVGLLVVWLIYAIFTRPVGQK